MWLGVSRGRPGYTLSHATLSPDLPLEEAQEFWDFSYEDVGLEDYTSMVSEIIASRPGSCDKVTLVTHSTGSNAALTAASLMPEFADCVGKIVTIAPCL